MKNAILALLASRKAVAVFLACACAATLCIAGKLDPAHFVAFVGALTSVLVASIAHEDNGLKQGAMAAQMAGAQPADPNQHEQVIP